MLVPRRYGGFEFDVPTFVRVIAHLARGCPSTAWQVCLPTAHALLVASWFDERAQDELFADPDFLCPSVAAPVGRAAPDRRRLPRAHRHPPLLLRRPVRDALPRPDAACRPRPRRPARRPADALRRPAQRVDDARRLGPHARPQGQRLQQHRPRRRPDPRVLRAARHADAPRRQLGRHARPAPARQPDVPRPRPELLRPGVHRARRRHGQGRPRRVPRAHHDAHDPPPADRPARPRSRLPALVRPRAREGRDGRGGDAAGRRAVDGGLPAPGRRRRALRRRGGPADPVDHARVGAPVLGRAAGVHVPHRGLRRRPRRRSACSASGATCRWSGATSPA